MKKERPLLEKVAGAIDDVLNDPRGEWSGTYEKPMKELAARGKPIFTPAIGKTVRPHLETLAPQAAALQVRMDEILKHCERLAPQVVRQLEKDSRGGLTDLAEEGNLAAFDEQAAAYLSTRKNARRQRIALKAARLRIATEAAELLRKPITAAALAVAKLALAELDAMTKRGQDFGFDVSEADRSYAQNIAACSVALARLGAGTAFFPRDVFQMVGLGELLKNK